MFVSSYLSGFILTLVGFFILLHKKFQKHPYQLIGWACVYNAIGFFLRYSNFLVCFLDLPWLFQLSIDPYYYLVNGTSHPIMIWNKFQSIYISWKVVSYISIYLNLAANSLIFIDLYLTIRNPFYARQRRAKWYTLFFLAILAAITVMTAISINSYGTSLNLYDQTRQKSFIAGLKVFTLVMTVCTCLPTVLVMIRLNKEGTSTDLREKVRKRHYLYFALYLGIILQVAYNQFSLALESLFPADQQWIAFTLEVIVFELIGVPLALIRLFEPYVFQTFKKEVRLLVYKARRYCSRDRSKSCAKKPSEKQASFASASLCSFLNSAMNIELVYLILLGINHFMENQEMLETEEATSARARSDAVTSRLRRQNKVLINKDAERTKIILEDVQFENPDLWNVQNQFEQQEATSVAGDAPVELEFLSSKLKNHQSGSLDENIESLQTASGGRRQNGLFSRKFSAVKELIPPSENDLGRGSFAHDAIPKSNTTKLKDGLTFGRDLATGRFNIELPNPRRAVNATAQPEPFNRQQSLPEESTLSILSSQTNQLNLKIKSEIISHEQHKFAEIMRLDGVSPSDVMDSLSVDKNRHMVFRAGQGAGLSGSFFFFSHDNRFLIKTVKQAEIKILLKMLDKMIDHFRATSNQSLLARVYGVFTIKTNMYAPLSIIVMQNTSMLQSTKHKNMVFDLKGSIANRKVKMGSREFQQMLDTLSHNKVLKDLNYLEINQALNQSVLSLDREQKDALEDLIRRDSMFLREQSLLDYSLLLVIEKVPVGSLPRVETVSKVLQSDAMTI